MSSNMPLQSKIPPSSGFTENVSKTELENSNSTLRRWRDESDESMYHFKWHRCVGKCKREALNHL